MAIQTVILAAGLGKRMHSNIPKVLHVLAGKTLLEHVIATALAMEKQTQPIIVFGHQGKLIQDSLKHLPVKWVEQKQQLGTGHALLQALPQLKEKDNVLVLCGDVPLISENTLKHLLEQTPKDGIGVITADLANPYGYGRIKRNSAQQIIGIVEEKDTSIKERKIQEINTGIYLLPVKFLKQELSKIKNNNKQGEYYLTDIIIAAVKKHIPIYSIQPEKTEEILGVNDCVQLAHLERYYQKQYAIKLMQQGTTLYDPKRFDVRGELQVGKDVTIDVNVVCEGKVIIGDNCQIGANCILRNTILGARSRVAPYSFIDGAEIGEDCIIGPFARIRPESRIAHAVHIGNFVEIKKSIIDKGTKINHLTYMGDSEVGSNVNIGAGTITCNYDGVKKHKTIIEDDVFIGSNTQLIAPVKIGRGATIGAGSTITEDAPANQLTLARVRQTTIKNWERPKKIKSD